MASTAFTAPVLPRSGTSAFRSGWALSGLVSAMLLLDGGMKIVEPELMIANSPPLGIPPDPALYRSLGLVLCAATLLYLAPRTAFVGAILLTGYLGGAIAVHVRVGSPLFSHTLFGLYLGVTAWAGLWLRDSRIRALIPLGRN